MSIQNIRIFSNYLFEFDKIQKSDYKKSFMRPTSTQKRPSNLRHKYSTIENPLITHVLSFLGRSLLKRVFLSEQRPPFFLGKKW
jgi:hypothetical protein